MTMALELPRDTFAIAPLDDQSLLRELLTRRWGDTLIMFGRTWKIGEFSALVAQSPDGTALGLATYTVQRAMMLVLTVDNFSGQPGIGKALLARCAEIGRENNVKIMRVVTTNDNTAALRYFQMQGFRIAAFYPGAIAIYRAVNPSLPEKGQDGIPIRDALELEIDL